jgi:hypothetical protein
VEIRSRGAPRSRGASIFINTAVLKIDRPNFVRPAWLHLPLSMLSEQRVYFRGITFKMEIVFSHAWPDACNK